MINEGGHVLREVLVDVRLVRETLCGFITADLENARIPSVITHAAQ